MNRCTPAKPFTFLGSAPIPASRYIFLSFGSFALVGYGVQKFVQLALGRHFPGVWIGYELALGLTAIKLENLKRDERIALVKGNKNEPVSNVLVMIAILGVSLVFAYSLREALHYVSGRNLPLDWTTTGMGMCATYILLEDPRYSLQKFS